jgi:hypothetical protein
MGSVHCLFSREPSQGSGITRESAVVLQPGELADSDPGKWKRSSHSSLGAPALTADQFGALVNGLTYIEAHEIGTNRADSIDANAAQNSAGFHAELRQSFSGRRGIPTSGVLTWTTCKTANQGRGENRSQIAPRQAP